VELFILAAVVALGVAIYKLVAAQKRREAFFLLANKLGFTYSHHDSEGLVHLPFALFREGDGRGVENVLAGTTDDRLVRLFDYWYYDERRDTDGDRHRTYERFSCAMTTLEASGPPLVLKREGFLSRLADHAGFRDIELESEEFNRRYELKCDDRRFAVALIDARMIQWLLDHGQDCRYEVVGNRLLCATGRCAPERLPWVLDQLHAFRDHVPSVVGDLYPHPEVTK
jgi:hypothetical protein